MLRWWKKRIYQKWLREDFSNKPVICSFHSLCPSSSWFFHRWLFLYRYWCSLCNAVAVAGEFIVDLSICFRFDSELWFLSCLQSGFTPLHIAAHYGNTNVATLLIQRNADVNFRAKVSLHLISGLRIAMFLMFQSVLTLITQRNKCCDVKS